MSQSDLLKSVNDRLRQAERDRQRTYECLGREFAIHAGVFPPTHFQSTGIYAAALPFQAGQSFWEIGCGSGVIAITAALAGCRPVVASDISPAAVDNTLENVRRHRLQGMVSVRQGDLFAALEPGERFDIIFWSSNFIFVPEDEAPDDPLYYPLHHPLDAFCDRGYRAHKRFLSRVTDHLSDGGKLYLGFSDQGDLPALETLLSQYGFHYRVVMSQQGIGEHSHRYDILQLIPD